MRPRAILALAVLSCAIVSGGWLVQRGLSASSHPANPPADAVRLFQQVMTRVHNSYVDSVAAKDVYEKAVDGLLLELGDPHSVYLTTDRLNRLNESTSGRYAGVGIQIDVRDGWITVVTPLPDSPAEAAGIRTGDRVVMIDGKPTHRWTADEASKALRGEPGTSVSLGVSRFGTAQPIAFKVVRRAIHIRSVPHPMMLRDGIGYLDLVTFSDSAAPELARQIDSLRALGMKHLLLDLRGDPGGLLDQGVGVSDLFLDAGQDIVSMRGRTPDVTTDYRDKLTQRWPDLILGVLVDSLSASASEIVAGALQDHDRAVVIGSPTYGKGSAQTIFKVPGGGLKLTIAKWFTPSGRSINRTRGPAAADPDSLKAKPRPEFRTDAGRKVDGGGGIRPDIVVIDTARGVAAVTLSRVVGPRVNDFQDVRTVYAMSFKGTGAIANAGFVVTPEMRTEFLRRLGEKKIVFDTVALKQVGPLLDRILGAEITRYLFGTQAEFRRNLDGDRVVQRAIEVMRAATTQKEALERK